MTCLQHSRSRPLARCGIGASLILPWQAIADRPGLHRQSSFISGREATPTREALVNRLTIAIRASPSLPEVLSTATRELEAHLRLAGATSLYNPENPIYPEHEFVAWMYRCPPACQLRRSRRPLSIGNAQPLVIDVSTTRKDLPGFSAFVRAYAQEVNLRSQIDYPVIVKGQFRGVICIHQTDRRRRWTEDELALVEAVAARLAIGISQAELFEMVARGKQEWETTFDAMSDGIFIFDQVGVLRRVNRAGAAMEHSHPRALLGRKCCDILRTSAEDETRVGETALADIELALLHL